MDNFSIHPYASTILIAGNICVRLLTSKLTSGFGLNEQLTDLLSSIMNAKLLLGFGASAAGGIVLSAAGFIPRVGLGRAVVLGVQQIGNCICKK